MKHLILIFMLTLPVICRADECVKMPAEFIDNRVYLQLVYQGKKFLFYTDSGRGLTPFIYDDIARKLNLKINTYKTEGTATITSTHWSLSSFV